MSGNPYEAMLRGAAIGAGLAALFSLFAWVTYYEPPATPETPKDSSVLSSPAKELME